MDVVGKSLVEIHDQSWMPLPVLSLLLIVNARRRPFNFEGSETLCQASSATLPNVVSRPCSRSRTRIVTPTGAGSSAASWAAAADAPAGVRSGAYRRITRNAPLGSHENDSMPLTTIGSEAPSSLNVPSLRWTGRRSVRSRSSSASA